MIAARHRSAEDRSKDPHHYSRLGVPNGWRKAEATQALAQANEIADTIIKDFEQQGIVPEVGIPDSDEEIAKAALREAVVMALAPGDKRTRLMAINTVLKFTKAPPVQRHATPLTTSEEWLMQVLSELKANQ
jgi:crotonobetainyl-CoA:carnitine CoA-transferase CaiB-like acyl-CoA transferase